MAKLRLTVACGAYDIVKPLIEGAVETDGLDLTFLTDMGPRECHWRMGRKHELVLSGRAATALARKDARAAQCRIWLRYQSRNWATLRSRNLEKGPGT